MTTSAEVPARARVLPILTYHSLDDSASVLSVPPGVFAGHMQTLRDAGIQTLSLPEAAAALHRQQLPARTVVLTFDDGFENFYTHGFPILQQHGFSATVFLVTDYCGRDNAWPGQSTRVPRQRLLGWPQIREMATAGIHFGAHSRTHSDLVGLSPEQAEAEMVSSKRSVERETGLPVEVFAYPYGTYDDTVRGVAGRHFTIACSTRLGYATLRSDPLALERLDIYYLRRPGVFRRLFSPDIRAYVCLRRLARQARAGLGDLRRPGRGRAPS